ncbi:MAG: hypothetical protein HOP02_13285 [Methylococcaceae bacterium]|nr:hypothetical protein [Methylococcaceae bacterium]
MIYALNLQDTLDGVTFECVSKPKVVRSPIEGNTLRKHQAPRWWMALNCWRPCFIPVYLQCLLSLSSSACFYRLLHNV